MYNGAGKIACITVLTDDDWDSCSSDNLLEEELYRMRLSNLNSDYKIANYELQSEIDQLNEELDELEKELDESQAEAEQSEAEKDEVMEQYNQEMDEYEKEIAALEEEVENYNPVTYQYNEYDVSYTSEEDGKSEAEYELYYSTSSETTDGERAAYCNSLSSCGEWLSNDYCVWCPHENLCTSEQGYQTYADVCNYYLVDTWDSYDEAYYSSRLQISQDESNNSDLVLNIENWNSEEGCLDEPTETMEYEMEVYSVKLDEIEDSIEDLEYKVDQNTETLESIDDKLDDCCWDTDESSTTSETNTSSEELATEPSVSYEEPIIEEDSYYSEDGVVSEGNFLILKIKIKIFKIKTTFVFLKGTKIEEKLKRLKRLNKIKEKLFHINLIRSLNLLKLWYFLFEIIFKVITKCRKSKLWLRRSCWL